MIMRWVLAAISSGVITLAHSPAGAQDTEAGRDLFLGRCIGCHAFACNRDGPRLGGLVGRQVGSVADYDGYTEALRTASFIWTVEKLESFFAAPDAVFPESTMADAGKVESAEDRGNLIAFLQTEDPTVNLCPSN